ncbi:MAG: thiamine diphosphokinase [Acidimicrobiales bacterium]|nr:thiamine diphosphokinase [Acidimicrobiales bacterium]HRW37940.1 thiamine diphosphokinase [Aquihabitans sp.]
MGADAPIPDEPIVLLATGGAPDGPTALPPSLPAGSLVVAADAGLARLHDAGIEAHHLVGDLDSVRPELVADAIARGTTVHRHLPDKDATDLELALDLIVGELAPRAGLGRLLVVGPGGGRLDHLLADLLALSAEPLADLEVTARLGAATVEVVRAGRPRAVTGAVGDALSLLPVHGPARGVTTTGVRWPLVDADLVAGTTRAMSNELTAPIAQIALHEGVLVSLRPGLTAPTVPPRATAYDPTPRAGGDR